MLMSVEEELENDRLRMWSLVQVGPCTLLFHIASAEKKWCVQWLAGFSWEGRSGPRAATNNHAMVCCLTFEPCSAPWSVQVLNYAPR